MARKEQDIRNTAILGKKDEYRLPNKEIATALVEAGVLFDVDLMDFIGSNRYYGVRKPYDLDDVREKAEELSGALVGV